MEAGVKYVQDNGLAGKQCESLGAQNVYLAHWEQTVADTRIHGTTRQQVSAHFLSVEKPKLLPLPASLFPVTFFHTFPARLRPKGFGAARAWKGWRFLAVFGGVFGFFSEMPADHAENAEGKIFLVFRVRELLAGK